MIRFSWLTDINGRFNVWLPASDLTWTMRVSVDDSLVMAKRMDGPSTNAAGVVRLQPLNGYPRGNFGPRNVFAALFCLSTLTACSSKQPQTGPARTSLKTSSPANITPTACPSSQLALSLDSGDGQFDGMSHSGTMLVLHNSGKFACIIPATPAPVFTDANHRRLNISASDASRHPSASTSRITLAAGQTATSDMRWISGDIYDNGHCESPARISLTVGEQEISAPFSGHLCGAGGKPSIYTMASFKPAEAPSTAATTHSMLYTCEDSRRLQAVYPDPHTAELTMAGKVHHLHIAVSADGARYVGDHWQWWTKGMHEGRLAPLKPGEAIASASGVSCTTH